LEIPPTPLFMVSLSRAAFERTLMDKQAELIYNTRTQDSKLFEVGVHLYMHRRSLLSWLGASAAGTLSFHPRVAAAPPQNVTSVVSLESFRVANADQVPRVHDYLGGTLLPIASRIHGGTRMALDAIVAPYTPEVLLLSVFSSFDEMLDTQSRMAAHSGIRQARATLESQHVLIQVQSQVLTAAPQSLRFPADFDRLAASVFEIRTYHAPAWHVGPPARLSEVFSRAGIHPIVNGSTAASEHLPQFTYLIPFESLAAREDSWSRLEGEFETGVKVTGKAIYKLAPYSRA
jgi:hypothetical protein